jgi:hypothetical protein
LENAVLVFLDESFRKHRDSGANLAVLAGVAIPESVIAEFFDGIHQMRRPYHGKVLPEDAELKGKFLLIRSVLDTLEETGTSSKWSLCEDVLRFSLRRGVRVFGLVTFDPASATLVHQDERVLDPAFRKLFVRIDRYVKIEYPGVLAKLVFDSRQDKENERNSRAITRFLTRSTLGSSFDSILKVPLFGVSQAHNYGLQVADLVTTVIGLRFAGEQRIGPLWKIVQRMLYRMDYAERRVSSLVLIKQPPEAGYSADAKDKPPGDR